MKKIGFILINFLTFNFLLATLSFAQCPICVVTVGGGMLIAKKLGVDDLLVSIWIAALNVALSFWLAPKIKTRFLHNPFILTLLMFASTLYYFQFTSQIGHPFNKLFGIDKIIFGQILGLVSMVGGNYLYLFIKKTLHHTPFPYAKVVFPFTTVLVITLFFKLAFKL